MALDMRRYENVLRKQTGKSVRPYRADGYVNLINRYGTAKDDTEQYFYQPEPPVPDEILEMFYEDNGLFAKIIDTPAEEAVKHGFELEGISDDDMIKFYQSAVDELDWEEVAMTGIKWARLYGGSLAIMLINDGHGLEDPVDWRHIKSIDDIVVYDRSMIMPDQTSLYAYEPDDPFMTRGSRLGTPEWYEISSPHGNFIVHDSRCLAFRNGILPLNATNEVYQLWGIPEYIRLRRAIRNAEIAHESAPKMLSKSVQPVYKMKDLAIELASEEGEDKLLRRLQAIDMARGLLNSIAIDAEGEDYSFQSFGFNGVSEVIDSSCNWLSALTNIPQTILFGRSPAGMNATGQADFENYYNYVERIQKRMLRSNLRYLLSIIFTAGLHTREIKEIPDINVKFNSLWSMTENDEVQLEAAKLQNEMTRAGIAGQYIDMQVLDPKEVRKELGKEDPMDPETMLNDMTEEELMESAPQGEAGGEDPMAAMMAGAGGQPQQEAPVEAANGAEEAEESNADYAIEGNAPATAPEATKLPQDMEEEPDHEDAGSDGLNWITMRGTHIPLDGSGTAVGGPVKGRTFSEASSTPVKNTVTVRVSDLKPDVEYPERVKYWKAQIKKGNRRPILLDINNPNRIIDGNHSLAAYQALGIDPPIYAMDRIAFLNGAGEAKDTVEFIRQAIEKGEAVPVGTHEDAEGEDLDWITLKNGVHVPIDPDGTAVGGPVEGMQLSHAETTEKPYSGLSDKAISIVNAHKDTPEMYGISREEREHTRRSLIEELKNAGIVVNNEDGVLPKAYVPSMSWEENRALNAVLQGGRYPLVSKEEYIKTCNEAGVKPRLHMTPEEVDPAFLYSSSGKLQSDGTPVYGAFGKDYALSNSEIEKYSATDRELNPEGNRKLNQSATVAVESMSDAERSAINRYTKQYGAGNYQDVNTYLATGEGSAEVAKAAELVTSALDHEIGADCITARGDSMIYGTGNDATVEKLLKKISRGDFSSAAKLKELLNGKTVDVPTAMSTSPGQSGSGFDRRSVQYIFKTPAKAKGVKIDALSAYGGGRSEVEKKLASTGLFGSPTTESEILFKPGTKYKIDDVNFVVGRDGKKKTGQVYITATILTGNEDEHEDEDEPTLLSTRKEENAYTVPKPEDAIAGAKSWLIRDTDQALTNTDDLTSDDWTDDEIKRRIRGVGVIVVDKNGKILTGIRKGGDGDNYGLLGGPGGHIEPGESFEDAAIRETYEEFGIVCKDLTFLALGDYENESGMIPAIFLCTDYSGTVHPIDNEMEDVRFREIEDILSYKLFAPFKSSLEILQNVLTFEGEDGNISMDAFVEEDHPRAENGQFTSEGGSSSDEVANEIVGGFGSTEESSTEAVERAEPSSETTEEPKPPKELSTETTEKTEAATESSEKTVSQKYREAISHDTIAGLISKGVLSDKFDPVKQDKHRKGTKAYRDERDRAEAAGDPLPSYFETTNERLVKQFKQLRGSGQASRVFTDGGYSYREEYDTGEELGQYYVESTGKYVPSSWVVVHYSKDGIHFVPGLPGKFRRKKQAKGEEA